MDTQLLTLSKIFTERLFRIPDYQRGYAWTTKQLQDFWNDIAQLETGRNHYTGVLTLEEVPDKVLRLWDDDYWIADAKSYQAFYVVDGQQRLTTAIILLQVILERLSKGKKLNYTSKADIQRKFIYDSKDDGISRSYVFGYEKDNPSYEFLKTKIFCEQSSTAPAQETIYTHNLEQAKHFFFERVKEFKHKDIETLYRRVTQHLLFNIFTISDDVDVCVAFETMNNRGKPLSYLELLKNRLIYLSLKFDEVDYEKNKLRGAINNCWKAIYHNLGRNKDNPLDDDKFLQNHYIIYFGKESYNAEGNVEEIRFHRLLKADYASDLLENRFVTKNVTKQATPGNKITLADIYNYVSSLQQSVEDWYKIFNPFDSDFAPDVQLWLDKLNRLGIDYFIPMIMVFFQKTTNKKKRLALLKVLEKNLFIGSLVDTHRPAYPLFDVRRHMHFEPHQSLLEQVIKISTGNMSTDMVVQQYSDANSWLFRDKHFRKAVAAQFHANGFYKWKNIRYFLFEYNLDLQSHSKTKRKKISWPEFTEHPSDFVSVEHIYPQRALHNYWKSRFNNLNSKQRTRLRHSLGNLLPLSKPKNSSLSNKPFPDKVDGKADSVVGYRYGCYAENEVSQCNEWTPQNILDRGIKLLDFMEKRWDIKLGDKQHKTFILGLDFLKKQRMSSIK